MKPVIVYVDDEPNNLVIFEASLPEEWEIHTFSSPLEAVEAISSLNPWVIVSDQRMPGMNGVKFLELAAKLCENSIKLITTGYSDENLVIDSIRTAHVFDYIVKPWDTDDLEIRIKKSVDAYLAAREREELADKLKQRTSELEKRNEELSQAMQEASTAKTKEESIRKELECWIPPIVSYATKENLKFPINKNLALMAIDIVESGNLHNQNIGTHTARQKILLEFSMLVVKHGGYVETFQGDAAYANFGLMDTGVAPCDAAFAVANEFRAALVGIQNSFNTTIECGVGLHFGENIKAMIHEYSVTTSTGIVIQKRFSTESSGIDLVHRMEKLTHKLPGSNIVMTQEFHDNIKQKLSGNGLTDIGAHLFKGQDQHYNLLLIPSNLASAEDIQLVQEPIQAPRKAA